MRKLSLGGATRKAAQANLPLGMDYFELSSSEKQEITDLMSETNWRQSEPERSSGRSRLHSFWNALSRRPRR